MSSSVSQCFSDQGALAKAIPGFKARQSQLDMANAVAGVVKDKKHLPVGQDCGN